MSNGTSSANAGAPCAAAAGAPAVEYRPFEPADLPGIARILGGIWWKDAGSAEAVAALGACDFASYYARATWSQVAVVDGAAAGIVLARAGDADADHRERWRAAFDESLAAARSICLQAAEGMEAYLEVEERIDARLLAESGCAPGFELVLFAVGEATRGLGVGKRLLNDAEAYLKAVGAPGYYLFTDTSCTWQFYEHRGLRRAARFVSDPAERDVLCDEYYVYAADFASRS